MKTSPASGEDRRFSPARPRLVPRAGAQDSLLCDPGLTDLTNPLPPALPPANSSSSCYFRGCDCPVERPGPV